MIMIVEQLKHVRYFINAILDMRNIGSAIIETGDITPPC